MSDEVSLTARGQRISGWKEIRVTRTCDAFPNAFEIGLTWRDPLTGGAVLAAEGDACEVRIGDDLVISGYIDRYVPGGDANSRSLKLSGRGRTQDLVDCSAQWPGGQVQGNALSIAQSLAQAYSVDVALGPGASAGDPVVGWALDYTETAAAIIQRVAQNAGLMAYEDANGRLLLASVGTQQATGSIEYGRNVEAWSIDYAMDQRYSEVVCCSQSTAIYGMLGGSDFFHTERDPMVPRPRRLDIIRAEVAQPQQAFTEQRAKWEVARRGGRATMVQVKLPSWRDDGGVLWAPNTLVPVSLPASRWGSTPLCIAQVSYMRSDKGTSAELTLYPREAFTIEPISLLPLNTAAFDTYSDPANHQ